MSKLTILEHEQIQLKLDRIAWQIAEEYYREKSICLVGIQHRGSRVAELIAAKLQGIAQAKIELIHIGIDKDNALQSDLNWQSPPALKGKATVIVDDVLNSGFTMSAIFKAVLEEEPKSVKVAVLANRDHKSFPIHADFVGVSLATTLKEHISFVEEKGKMTVYLV